MNIVKQAGNLLQQGSYKEVLNIYCDMLETNRSGLSQQLLNFLIGFCNFQQLLALQRLFDDDEDSTITDEVTDLQINASVHFQEAQKIAYEQLQNKGKHEQDEQLYVYVLFYQIKYQFLINQTTSNIQQNIPRIMADRIMDFVAQNSLRQKFVRYDLFYEIALIMLEIYISNHEKHNFRVIYDMIVGAIKKQDSKPIYLENFVRLPEKSVQEKINIVKRIQWQFKTCMDGDSVIIQPE